ncbi:uncharacterized abhydrolase domain-containing protein DDB_G0269086-like [Battus philenor]|uniref:uncharacterized abhydrolase domain-containing protein DDB_G0269086-like n=1 Tax=Battus philenor TaxID=42288 RepID=UPI0035D0E1D4
MGDVLTDFESFEHQLSDVIGELQSIMSVEVHLREEVRSEASRAEAAEAACAAARRDADESRASAAAAAAGIARAAAALTATRDELTVTKSKLHLTEHERSLLETKCSELSERVEVLERELQELRPLKTAHSTLQRQYVELDARIRAAIEEAHRETDRLEGEVRRVERSARGGEEVRERARLAAAANARERRLAAADLQHTSADLQRAYAEVARLNCLVSEMQQRLSDNTSKNSKIRPEDINELDTFTEVRAALDAERAGAEKIKRALAAALADNATLAALLNKNDNPASEKTSPFKEDNLRPANICPIDSFLAD